MSPKTAVKRIMVFGTFDMLHPGHAHFLQQARGLANNPYLIVSIARDLNVKRIKGKLPVHNERQRAGFVKNFGLADKVVLGGLADHVPHIVRYRPDIIALGYDQYSYTDNLQEALVKKQLYPNVIRLRAHKPKVYKTSLLRKKDS